MLHWGCKLWAQLAQWKRVKTTRGEKQSEVNGCEHLSADKKEQWAEEVRLQWIPSLGPGLITATG